MAAPVPILIDTDIGDDIDDALAIAFALRSPEVDVVGITTVFQRAALRARLARHLCAAYGRSDVPVVGGLDRPLLGIVRPDWSPNQASVLEGDGPAAPPGGAERARAVDFIIAQGLRREGLVLVPIGAMTNVAVALAAEPALAGRVRVVAMGGAWDRDSAEWNIACDPEAAAAVLASGVAVDFVGLDVTMGCRMRAPDMAALSAAPASAPDATLLAFLRAWQGASGGHDRAPILHDPLAVAAVFRPDLLGWEEGRVSVDLGAGGGGGSRRGATRLTTVAGRDGEAGHRVARRVDADGFLALFGERVCRGPSASPGAAAGGPPGAGSL